MNIKNLLVLVILSGVFLSCGQPIGTSIRAESLKEKNLDEITVLHIDLPISNKSFFGRERISESFKAKASQSLLDRLLNTGKQVGVNFLVPPDSVYKGAIHDAFIAKVSTITKKGENSESTVISKSGSNGPRGKKRTSTIQPKFDFSNTKLELKTDLGFVLTFNDENIGTGSTMMPTQNGMSMMVGGTTQTFKVLKSFIVDIESDSVLWAYNYISSGSINDISAAEKTSIIKSMLFSIKYGKDSTPDSFDNLNVKREVKIVMEDEAFLVGYILSHSGFVLTVVDPKGKNPQPIHLNDVKSISHSYGDEEVIFPLSN